MLAEFVNKIQEMARAAIGVSTQKVDGFPNEVFVVQGGSYTRVPLPPPMRKQALYTLTDLVTYLKDAAIAPAPEVYHNHQGVTAYLDAATRTEIVLVSYAMTKRAEHLFAMAASRKTFSVKDLVRFLRHDLDVSSGTIGAFRTIDFERKGTGTNTVVHGRESLGRSVEAKVQNAESIPESFVVETTLFRNRGFDYDIKVMVDVEIESDQERISLSVKADDLNEEVEKVHAAIGLDLRGKLGDKVNVFFGGSR